jgi:O-acetyl-ADP-ribose deacetylase (regulator of RNase III)
MLIYRRTSVLESTAQTLVNTVNCVGVMGKGIAQAFKESEPGMFDAYRKICDSRLLEPGKLWIWQGLEHWVLNFPTKVHWRSPSKLEWIEAGLDKFVQQYEAKGIREISFPRLGCGNGGLDWEDVRPLMEHYLSDLSIPVFVHDFAKDVSLPEHLAAAGEALGPAREIRSFDAFQERFFALLANAGDQLVDLETAETFHAERLSDDLVAIEAQHGGWQIDLEDIRGAWLGLQEGLLTSSKVDQSLPTSGAPLISIFSVLPEFRPVEILRRTSNDPEVAVEIAPGSRRYMPVPAEPRQPELRWH